MSKSNLAFPHLKVIDERAKDEHEREGGHPLSTREITTRIRLY
jgi:hypothetical protein